MFLHFLCASLANMSLMFALDVYWILLAMPRVNHALSWERPTSMWWSPLKVIAGLLMFDLFVYLVHRFLEHGALWKWHRQHHSYVSDKDLTYYTACQIGAFETLYYLVVILVISITLGTSALETSVLMTWIFQHGAYMHHRGLPELPWPLISCRHHRTHHFNAKRYYGGLFLFWDRADPIDRRAL
jgi:sterol desaturase/sphingolipid hydroxylase (fatty acid hydroxylase superfamily)